MASCRGELPENAHSRLIAPGPDFAVPYASVTYADLAGIMRQARYDFSDLSQRRSNSIGYEVFQRLPGRRLIALSVVETGYAPTCPLFASGVHDRERRPPTDGPTLLTIHFVPFEERC